ncbi:hypothetical protein MRA01_04830 [Methylobacterium radiotolerans]|nr:hypothetical protein MRA01_04830 [Methylobacterium radiotolerans]
MAFVLYLVRHQLAALAKRVEEITFPGGGGAKFRDEVRDVQTKLENITESDPEAAGAKLPRIRNETPREKIRNRFADLENEMSLILAQLPLEVRRQPSDFIFYDLREFKSSFPLYDLYSRIRELNNMALYADEKALSENDAREFDELCATFLEAFKIQFEEFKKRLAKEPAGSE